jgi:outer membrane translocation and assembly module TamA
VPDFSTVSVHVRRDEYRSLPVDPRTRSWFHRSRPWRDNPPIDDGDARTVSLRLERAARSNRHRHAGLYHWLEIERAGRGLGGDFDYLRMLGDLRSVLRLTPATTLNLRLVAGHTASGVLPAQKAFVVGGVDGLRAHAFDTFKGDQMLLTQAEYAIGLWRLRRGSFRGGLDALAFVDAGTAWSDPEHRWNIGDRHVDVDAGVGLATAEGLRLYVARDLQRSNTDLVLTVRLHRPF